jgi:uncharacterized protein YcbK (DUF882 family)
MTSKQKKIVIAVACVSIIVAVMLILYYYFVTNVENEEIDMYESKYFSIGELTYSKTAERLKLDNRPTDPEVEYNLKALIMKVLDPLREAYGRPIYVNSGYRSPLLNSAVGGAATSQHLRGQAVDITAGSKTENRKLYELIRQMGEFDQLIDESDFSWVHVSYKRIGYNRRQTLKL